MHALFMVEHALEALSKETRGRYRKVVSEGLRGWRIRRGIGLREMARRIGQDPSNLHKFESGRVWSDKIAYALYDEYTKDGTLDGREG